MSNYNNGVNDAMMGAAIGDLSVGVGNALLERFRNNSAQRVQNNTMEQIQRRDDIIAGITEANEINVKNGLIWKAKALEAEESLGTVRNQSKSRLVRLMEKSGAFNKSEAMRIALREGIDELFEEGHVNYDKEQFDHEVNDDYIKERLKLDKETKEFFKGAGTLGEAWLPDEDYLQNDFQDFKDPQ